MSNYPFRQDQTFVARYYGLIAAVIMVLAIITLVILLASGEQSPKPCECYCDVKDLNLNDEPARQSSYA